VSGRGGGIAPNLLAESRAARQLLDWLRAQEDYDEEVLTIAVEGQTSLVEAASLALAAIDDDEALIAGCLEKVEQIQARVLRLRERSKNRRAALARAIEDAGLPRLPLPEALLSLSKRGPAPDVYDETQVPERFWKEEVRVTRKLDRAAVAAALTEPDGVPGARLTNGTVSLNVRRR
jgi:hypothetical protein